MHLYKHFNFSAVRFIALTPAASHTWYILHKCYCLCYCLLETRLLPVLLLHTPVAAGVIVSQTCYCLCYCFPHVLLAVLLLPTRVIGCVIASHTCYCSPHVSFLSLLLPTLVIDCVTCQCYCFLHVFTTGYTIS